MEFLIDNGMVLGLPPVRDSPRQFGFGIMCPGFKLPKTRTHFRYQTIVFSAGLLAAGDRNLKPSSLSYTWMRGANCQGVSELTIHPCLTEAPPFSLLPLIEYTRVIQGSQRTPYNSVIPYIRVLSIHQSSQCPPLNQGGL